MTLLFIGFILGLLTSRWLETLLTRLALRLSLPEGFRSAVRANARERGIDTKERGKIVKTDAYESARSMTEGNVLANLDRDADTDSE